MDEKNNNTPDIADQVNDGLKEPDLFINGNNDGDHLNNQASPSSIAAEVNEIDKLKQDIVDYKDKYIRLVADFENYKRRNAKERIELMQTAGKEIVTSLLDVLDDCDRAEKQINTSNDIEQIKEGVQLVFNKLRNTLYSKGLKAMNGLNTDFDVEKHEAITEIEVSDKSLKGKVVDEVVKGYYLNDKLIRFAKVVVAK